MSEQKRNVPKLRFPGFTDAWEQRKVSEIMHRATTFSDDPTLPNVEYEDVESGQGLLNKNLLEKAVAKKGLLFEPGDILFGKLRPYLKNWLRPAFSGIAVGDWWVLKPDLATSEFLYAFIQGSSFQNIANMSTGTKMPRSDWNLVANTEFGIPSEQEEQALIGSFFRDLDDLITLHQRKLDHLKLQKRGLLQKMFPRDGSDGPEIRFPGFTDAWEQRKLGELCSFAKGRGYSKADICDSGVPLILYGRLYTQYQARIDDVDTFAVEREGSLFSCGNEVIVPASGETAEDIAVASSVRRSGIVLGGDLNVLTPGLDLDPDYVALVITYGKTHSELAKRAQGKSVVHIHNDDIAAIDFSYPTAREQRAISSLALSFDDLITLHQRKLDHLKLQKKALLQQMFI
ncbi:restriction endonuclease subunit S [Eggerthella lenta]|uniref:restriction endonuclease subunit S n=2 Tax=Eggerthella lenta TaxID=84112 RepID=UPI0018973D11|nr:restriction endonuclease subunit S [Eggerthella lenta]